MNHNPETRDPKPALCALALTFILAAALSACHSHSVLKGVVPNEARFEGAVAVVQEASDGDVNYITVDIPYRDVHGNAKMGQGRLIARRSDVASGKRLPAFCHVHYEKSVGGAKHWCDQGWAVATAHYQEKGQGYPIDVSVGDGYNLAHALIQWVRRIPIIDRAHLHIDGGSQGGYMALAMSADFLPVTATTADAPVVNWAYNLNYFEVNKPAAHWPESKPKDSPLAGMCSVLNLNDWAYAVFGKDLRSDTWYCLSPISFLDCIANPVLIVCSTGDMLVPMEQMTRKPLPARDASRFPKDYQRDFDTLTICEPARKTFEELVPPDQLSVQAVPLSQPTYEVEFPMITGEKKRPPVKLKTVGRPWSDKHQWSVCELDEGGPLPCATHTSYAWDTSPDSFVKAHQDAKPAASLLNAAKLKHLLQRYTGQLDPLPKLADGTPANRLNFDVPERFDVVTGLLDYAGFGEDCAAQLRSLYAASPVHPFGDTLDLDALRILRAQLLPSVAAQQGAPS